MRSSAARAGKRLRIIAPGIRITPSVWIGTPGIGRRPGRVVQRAIIIVAMPLRVVTLLLCLVVLELLLVLLLLVVIARVVLGLRRQIGRSGVAGLLIELVGLLHLGRRGLGWPVSIP